MSAEAKALDFFRRADLSDALEKNDDRHSLAVTASRPVKTEARALDFFRRAELSDVLMSIWEFIKRQRFSTALKMTKAVALVAAVVLFSQGMTLSGLFALGISVVGLLIAAISNVLVWLIYLPLYFVNTPDFASSLLLAVGMAWLGGVAPFFALVFSPVILFGMRLLEHAEVAQMRVAEIISAPAKIVERLNIRAALQQAGNKFPGSVNGALPELRLALATS